MKGFFKVSHIFQEKNYAKRKSNWLSNNQTSDHSPLIPSAPVLRDRLLTPSDHGVHQRKRTPPYSTWAPGGQHTLLSSLQTVASQHHPETGFLLWQKCAALEPSEGTLLQKHQSFLGNAWEICSVKAGVTGPPIRLHIKETTAFMVSRMDPNICPCAELIIDEVLMK